jgi:hypothetical protein
VKGRRERGVRGMNGLRNSTMVRLLLSPAGAAMAAVSFSRGVHTPLGRIHPQDVGVSVKFGGAGMVLGFVLALVGVLLIPDGKTRERSDPPAAGNG